MKRPGVLLCMLFMHFCCLAQRAITTKVVPMAHDGRKDTLYLPVASANYPELREALAEKVLLNGETAAEAAAEYAECGCGITSLNYNVTYLNDGVLCISLQYETMGAYPGSMQQWLTLDMKTGKPIPLSQIFTQQGITYIFATYKTILKQRIAKAQAANKDDADSKQVFPGLKQSIDTLTVRGLREFLFTEGGFKIKSDPVLPHVVQALEPNREVVFDYKHLMKYFLPNGRFGKSRTRRQR